MAFKLAFKVVITSTVVYWTNQLEIWSELSRKERVYDRWISCAKQMIKKNTPGQLKFELPSIADNNLCATTNYYYNKGVMNTFGFLQNIPSNVANLYGDAVKQLNTAPATPKEPSAKSTAQTK